jgi:hypothetical protein
MRHAATHRAGHSLSFTGFAFGLVDCAADRVGHYVSLNRVRSLGKAASRSDPNGSEGLPRPDLLVTITGFCEILGAVGLLISRVAPVAALGLILLLVALFPANVRAARQGMTIAGRPATPLPVRTLI